MNDLQRVPVIVVHSRNKLLAHSDGIRFSEHLDGDGAIIFAHACKLGLEGIVSKRRDLPYRLRPVPGMDQTGHTRRLNLAFSC